MTTLFRWYNFSMVKCSKIPFICNARIITGAAVSCLGLPVLLFVHSEQKVLYLFVQKILKKGLDMGYTMRYNGIKLGDGRHLDKAPA